MKQIILFTFLSLATISNAQTTIYHPFPDSNAHWNFYIEYFCFPMQSNVIDHYSIEIGTDTAIGGSAYHKLQAPYLQSGSNGICPYFPIGYKGAIRQDTTLRAVYIVPPGDSIEQILYDFNLQVGDTVRGYLQRGLSVNETVVSIDSIIVGGNYRKRWLINPMYQLYLIEGVGWMDGLIEASPGQILDAQYHGMICFSQDGILQFSVGTSDCDLIDEVEINELSNEIIGFPNPTKNISKMQLPFDLINGYYKVYNSTGKLMDENTIGNSLNFEYDLSSFHNGVYLFKFISAGGKFISCKLIKN